MANETAAERRERLKALRAAAELAQSQDEPAAEAAPEETETVEAEERALKFRNYLPQDQELQEGKVPIFVPEEFEEVEKAPVAGLDDKVELEDAITSLAPKKANWDLKRDVAKKLAKLERRTQKAMVEMMSEAQAEAAA